MKQCTDCKFNAQKNEACIKCAMQNQQDTYQYKFARYIKDGYEPKANDTSGSEPVTDLNDEDEDKFRKALYELFDLTYNELMLLKAIMNGKDLQSFANEMEKLAVKNQEFTRFRAFQTRKAIGKKLPKLKSALITSGQRKPLKY